MACWMLLQGAYHSHQLAVQQPGGKETWRRVIFLQVRAGQGRAGQGSAGCCSLLALAKS